MAWDFNKEEDIKKYLDNLFYEYSFGCNKEKNPEACHLLGEYFETVKNDAEKAFSIYRETCQTYKYPHSCAKYGTLLMRGIGGTRKPDEALEVFTIACDDAGDSRKACFHGGMLSLLGTSKYPRDTPEARNAMNDKAVAMLSKCCERRDPECCFLLSGEYLKGKTLPKDKEKSLLYGIKACELQLPHACANVSRMYKTGDGVERNEKRAAIFGKKAEDLFDELQRRPPENFNLTG